MLAQLQPENPADGCFKPQPLSLKASPVSTGMIDGFVSESDLIKVSIMTGKNFTRGSELPASK